MDELIQHGKAMGVLFRSVKTSPAAVEPDGKRKIVPVEIKVEAQDIHLAAFLGSLACLKQGTIRLKSFDIRPFEKDHARLSAEVMLSVYFTPEEYAE